MSPTLLAPTPPTPAIRPYARASCLWSDLFVGAVGSTCVHRSFFQFLWITRSPDRRPAPFRLSTEIEKTTDERLEQDQAQPSSLSRGNSASPLTSSEPAGSCPQEPASWMRWSVSGPSLASAPRRVHSFDEVFGMVGLCRTATARSTSAAV